MTITKKDLSEAINKALNDARHITDETHKLHHDFIQYLIEKQESRKKLWMKFKLSLVGSAALALVGFLMWIGKLIWDHLPPPNP